MKDSRPFIVYYLNYMIYFRGVVINTIINRLSNIRSNSVIGPCVSDVTLGADVDWLHSSHITTFLKEIKL